MTPSTVTNVSVTSSLMATTVGAARGRRVGEHPDSPP
jgi:hypothetical protein